MRHRSTSGDLLTGLILFCVFAGAMLMVLISGAGAYKKIGGELGSLYNERTSLGYISTKVRSYDEGGAVYLEDFEGLNCLVLEEASGETKYLTRIYHYEGYIRELYSEAGIDLGPDAGEELIAAKALDMEYAGEGLLRISCTADERSEEIFISISSEKAGDPA
ncbi:MAG: DUF4860 domain-containing protein [Firmicutes bacterium]|nr:DUF4860 domain-containing protein [Bacillota bacterium]